MMTNDLQKQQNLRAAVEAARRFFAGTTDAEVYKNYILVMLLLKYISDNKKEAEVPVSGESQLEGFNLPASASFYDLYERREEVNIGKLMNDALDSIEEANGGILEGVFRNIDFNSEVNLGRTRDRNQRLEGLLEHFNKPELDMHPSQISRGAVANVYGDLVEGFTVKSRSAGMFYTPQKLSELVVKLCNPKAGASVCDPACGTGGMLVEARKAVGGQDISLYGMDVNGSAWTLCRINMFLHGEELARIEWCNTLTSPAFVKDGGLMKFDYVVSNPPISLADWGADKVEADRYNRFGRGVPPSSKADYAFISHMIEAAKEKEGRVAVVVSHGVLFRGAVEGQIRQKLVEENVLDAVIGLPDKLLPGAPVSVAVLVFDRSREKGGVNESRKDVLFVDASQDYQLGRNQNTTLLDEHLDKVLGAYGERKVIEGYAHLASSQEIMKNGFDLSVSRYVRPVAGEGEIDAKKIREKVSVLESQLANVRQEIDAFLGNMA